jgi:hypothetical protein
VALDVEEHAQHVARVGAVLDDQDPSPAHMAILPAARDQRSAQN